MKRALIFGLAGPGFGFLTAIALAAALGVRPFEGQVLFVILAYAFAAGIVPAALTGAVDWHLSSRMPFRQRVVVTAGAGFLICVLVGLTLLSHRMSMEAIFIFALIGMIAAAVCSGLSGKQQGAQ